MRAKAGLTLNDPATPLMADNSPTPKVVTRADIPLESSVTGFIVCGFYGTDLDSCISIGGIGGIELIAVPHPVQTIGRNVVEKR